MALTVEEIEKEIRSFETEDRGRLFRDLVAEIDGEEEKEVESLWLKEAEHRLEELESGAVKGVPLDDVLRKARARLKHGN